jgi:hypothetical protein
MVSVSVAKKVCNSFGLFPKRLFYIPLVVGPRVSKILWMHFSPRLGIYWAFIHIPTKTAGLCLSRLKNEQSAEKFKNHQCFYQYLNPTTNHLKRHNLDQQSRAIVHLEIFRLSALLGLKSSHQIKYAQKFYGCISLG